MWRRPLKLSSTPELLLALCIAATTPLALPASALAGEGAPSHLGPASEEEAALLWKDGRADFNEGRFQDAIPKLRRLLDRYPGYAGFLEAHRLLGISYLETEQAERAIPVLKAYSAAVKKPAESAAAKLLLVRAYLATNRRTEALLLTEEVIAMPLQQESHLRAEALLLKARSLMKPEPQESVQNDRRAEGALGSARKLIANAPDGAQISKLRSEASLVALALKHRACSRLPTPGRLSEAQVLDQLGRRGDCLLESLTLSRAALDRSSPDTARTAANRTTDAFRAYAEACRNPPEPEGTSRTASELKAYREELTRVLDDRCRGRLATALEILDGWRGDGSLEKEELKRAAQAIRAETGAGAKK